MNPSLLRTSLFRGVPAIAHIVRREYSRDLQRASGRPLAAKQQNGFDSYNARYKASDVHVPFWPERRAWSSASLLPFSIRRLSIRRLSKSQLKEDRDEPPKHFMLKGTTAPISDIGKQALDEWEHEAKENLPHPVWTDSALKSVKRTHYKPHRIRDVLAFMSVKTMRFCFDLVSGYSLGLVNERGWIRRIIFLETVAGVPGLVGAMVRHLRSLRRMERDYGWIHTLLEEAENERMHLMTALQLKKPGFMFRSFVLLTQGIFMPMFTIAYFVSPSFAHRFVGYLEEEAVKTYTKLIDCIQAGKLPGFTSLACPKVGKKYWQMNENAMFVDLIYAIRADESHHRDVNHTFAQMKRNEPNPFPPGH